MKGLFDLASPQDLCRKLERDYERVLANPADVDAAFHFVVTAWHLLEWFYPGSANNSKRAAIRDANPILLVCEHLAVGAKHFQPEQKRLESVDSTARDSVWGKGTWKSSAWAPGTWKDDLVVHLDGPAKAAFGDSLKIKDIAKLAMAFWKTTDRCGSVGSQ